MALQERLDSLGTGGTPIAWVAAVIGGSLVAATAAAALLEGVVGISDGSPVYLLAVVLVAGLFGTWPAALTSVLAFLAYDYLFTTPRFTFAVADPGEWLSLLLFLLVAVVIGRLAGLLRERAEMADRRAREAASLVAISPVPAPGGRRRPGRPRIAVPGAHQPLIRYLEMLAARDPDTVIVVLISERIIRHWWERFLYNQNAHHLRDALTGHPGILIANVPFRRAA